MSVFYDILIPEKGLIIMINRLEAIKNRYNEISNELSSPEVINDIKKIEAFTKEKYKDYSGLVIQYMYHSKRNK